MTYDSRDRVTRVDEAYGSSVQRSVTMIYDRESNLTSITTGIASTNPNPLTTSFAYDALNQTTRVIEAFGVSLLQRTTTLNYDKVGNLTQSTDPLGRVTSFAYDNRNQLVREDDAFGTSVQRSATMIYDAVGNLLSETVGIASTNALSPITRE